MPKEEEEEIIIISSTKCAMDLVRVNEASQNKQTKKKHHWRQKCL